MQLSTLSSWLEWIGSVHKKEWDLGLDRIREVAAKLNLLTPTCPVVIVGGTNGKGSVVRGLESIYLAAGYRVGTFTSPYLFVHNEEVRVNGKEASDQEFCDAFAAIEAQRGTITLTPFEYHTLAALLIFKASALNVMILEVGLGGRLDAVNILDADAAVITSIGIDHIEWLGDTREKIAIEKAGIFRHGQQAICGDDNPPVTLIQAANEKGVVLHQRGRDFQFIEKETSWQFQTTGHTYVDLPRNDLLTGNMAAALMTITALQPRLPVTEAAIRRGLQEARLIGRIQVVEGPVTEIYDVSHNPAAANVLAKRLKAMPCSGKTAAVFSMLGDKDIPATIVAMREVIDEWYVAPLTGKRAAGRDQLQQAFAQYPGVKVTFFDSLTLAYQAACRETSPGDRLIIFGSFYTVADIMRLKPH